MRRLWVLLLIAGAATGCRKSEDSAREGETVTIETEDGRKTLVQHDGDASRIQMPDGTVTVGRNSLPAGFPLPVAPGTEVKSSSHFNPPDKDEMFQITTEIAAPVDKIAEFYEKAMKDKGLEVSRLEQKSDRETLIVLTGKSDKVEAMVSTTRESKAARTAVVVHWSQKK